MKDKKNKKPRDVSYSQGYKIIEKHGYEAVKRLWVETGMYFASRELNCSPYVLRHLSHKFSWKRPASSCPHLVRAVQLGRAEASTYKHLDWSNVEINLNNNKKEESNEQ